MKESRNQSRREFLRRVALISLVLGITPGELFSKGLRKKKRIVILHTNDFHSRIEPFPSNHPKFANQGGIARIKTLIDGIRAVEKNVLLFDSGDIFQGTPYFNIFGGTVEIDWMNKAGFMAGTIGNHDFDNGLQSLANATLRAKFPLLNCNYDVKGSPLEGRLERYRILEIDGRRIGVTGVGIDPNGLISPRLCENVRYLDPIAEVQKVADALKKKKCDMVILLSHLGFEYADGKVSDKKLAAETRHIDLILGGHTHTFLDKPVTVTNKDARPVVINQAAWAGLRLGKLVYEI